jgi:hypothetical protein
MNGTNDFSEGKESLKDDDRPGRPRTVVTDYNEKVLDVIRKDRRLCVRVAADKSVWTGKVFGEF